MPPGRARATVSAVAWTGRAYDFCSARGADDEEEEEEERDGVDEETEEGCRGLAILIEREQRDNTAGEAEQKPDDVADDEAAEITEFRVANRIAKTNSHPDGEPH